MQVTAVAAGVAQGDDSACGGSSGSRRKQRRRWLVPAAAVTLAHCSGAAVQARQN